MQCYEKQTRLIFFTYTNKKKNNKNYKKNEKRKI